MAQLLHHAVERSRELADFVARDHLDRSIEVAGLDFAGTLQQQSDRPGNAAAHEHREKQSECGSKGGNGDRNENCMPLVAQHDRSARIDLGQHFGAYFIELLVEFIAGLIRAREAAPDFWKILGLKLIQKLRTLRVQVPMQLVYRIVYVGIDA